MPIVRPTTLDVSRAVIRLNEQQDEESLERVARNMAFKIGPNVRLRKITKRDAALMLAVHDADDFVIEKYAGPLAGRLRAYSDECERMGAFI